MNKIYNKYLIAFFFMILFLMGNNGTFGAGPHPEGPGNPPPPPSTLPKISESLSAFKTSLLKSNNFDLLNLEEDPSFQTAFKLDGSGLTQISATARDQNGNIYVTGGFSDSLSFNTLPNATTLISSSYLDVFSAKYDAAGNCLWVRQAKGNSSILDSLSIDGGLSIAVDKAGNSYVGGAFVSTLTFLDENNQSAAKLNSNDTTLANFEFFIAKYNTDGELLWAKGGNSGSAAEATTLKSGINAVTSVILDAEELPYIGGKFSGSNFLGQEVELEEDGDFFLAALNPDNGSVEWAEVLGTGNNDGVISLALDIFGYINALGFMGQGAIPFPTSPETVLTNENEYDDTFVAKFDINGNCIWADLIGGDENIIGESIAADTLGNIFIAGSFKGTATFTGSDIELTASGSYGDGYLAKYDFNGNALWARRFGDELFAMSNKIAVDEIGNSFVFGTFVSSVIFGSEKPENEIRLTSDTYVDMFIASYDSSGNYLWTKRLDDNGYGGVSQISGAAVSNYQVSARNNPLSLSYNNSNGGELILAGDFNNQLFLGETTLNAEEGSRNSFIAKLSLTGNPTNVNSINSLPSVFSLSQNYPNPFNPNTIISYQLPKQSSVSLKIFDMLGREVKTLVNEIKPAGNHIVNFNAENISSGIYFYTLNTQGFTQSKKMMLIK